MSSIENNPAAPSWHANSALRTHAAGGSANSGSATGNADAPGSNANGDTVEISDAARERLQNDGANQPRKPVSAFEIEEVLVPDSKEDKEYRELLKTVKEQRSGIMSRIESTLRDNGISIQGQGKMKLEIDSSGRIVVGGLKDKKLAKEIEEKLNQDKALAKDIKEYQKNEKDLSALVKKYTGVNLYELTQTASGDINKRIRDTVDPEMEKKDEYFTHFGFLGEANSIINRNNVDALSFNGMIDFSGEIDTMAQPEKNIRESMKDLGAKIEEQFNAENSELLKRLEDAGIELTEETRKSLLGLANAKITVDSQGGVTVEGKLSENEEAHKKGVAIINKLVREMLNEYDANSYHVSTFVDASEHLLSRRAEERNIGKNNMAWNSKVTAELLNGSVGGIRIS